MKNMPRTQEQVGQLAFKVFEALSKVEFGYEDLKSLGEHIYANSPKKAADDKKDFTAQSQELLGRVRKEAVIKLFRAAAELDLALPLPNPAAEAELKRAAELEATRAAELEAEVAELRRQLTGARELEAEVAELRRQLTVAGKVEVGAQNGTDESEAPLEAKTES